MSKTKERPLTYGEAVTRLCQLRDELRATEYGSYLLGRVISALKVAAPVVRDTETQSGTVAQHGGVAASLGDDDPTDAVVSTTYVISAADLYASTPEPTDIWGMTEDERGIVERVVEQEARGESHLGQMAVVQCIRTAAEADGLTPYEVVMQEGQYADPALEASESVKAAVQAVLYDGESAVNADIRWFYAPDINGTSSWHETQLEYVCDIGNHRFFAEKEDDNDG